MKLDILREDNVAYLQIVDRSEEEMKGIVKRSAFARNEAGEDLHLIIDYGENDEIIGIEFLNVNKQLKEGT